MEVKTFQSMYDLAEFHCYVTKDQNGECISIIELLLNPTDTTLDYIESDFASVFVVESEHHTYVFSGYEVSEYYIDNNGLVKVICIK